MKKDIHGRLFPAVFGLALVVGALILASATLIYTLSSAPLSDNRLSEHLPPDILTAAFDPDTDTLTLTNPTQGSVIYVKILGERTSLFEPRGILVSDSLEGGESISCRIDPGPWYDLILTLPQGTETRDYYIYRSKNSPDIVRGEWIVYQ